MSKTKVPPKTIQALWVISGGRCEFDGCNKPLWYDILTKRNCNSAYVAHIIADEPGGPRGDTVLSEEKCKDLDNLMLMCGTHHNMIDNKDNVERYTVEVLKSMKKVHEDRIEFLTSLKNKNLTNIIFYTPNTGQNVLHINPEDAIDAVLPEYYPVDRYPIELHCKNSVYTDDEDKFWEYEREQLVKKFQVNIKSRIDSGDIKHLSVFALAPQPLLIELGRQISDIRPAIIYQKHREPDNWKWLGESTEFEYIIKEPQEIHPTVALNLSLSATIGNDRIIQVLGNEVSIWTMTIENPGNDYLKSKIQQSLFKKKMRYLFDKIKLVHGQNSRLNIFPACPASIAVEIGRIWMPKADMSLSLYDQNKKENCFVHTFDIE